MRIKYWWQLLVWGYSLQQMNEGERRELTHYINFYEEVIRRKDRGNG